MVVLDVMKHVAILLKESKKLVILLRGSTHFGGFL